MASALPLLGSKGDYCSPPLAGMALAGCAPNRPPARLPISPPIHAFWCNAPPFVVWWQYGDHSCHYPMSDLGCIHAGAVVALVPGLHTPAAETIGPHVAIGRSTRRGLHTHIHTCWPQLQNAREGRPGCTKRRPDTSVVVPPWYCRQRPHGSNA